MTSPINSELIAKFRAAGITVKGVPGWRDRGRPGSFDPKGLLNHHTGSNTQGSGYVDWMAREGRAGLPAPLCQFALEQDGTLWVLAAGRANHAGKTSGAGLTVPGGDGNTDLAGLEMMYDGTNPPDRMVDVAVLVNAVFLRHIGASSADALGHRETSVTGKWDPGAISMTGLRRRVRVVMARLAVTRPVPTTPSDNGEVYHVKAGVTSWARASASPSGKKVKRLSGGENYRLYAAKVGPDGRVWRRTDDGNWLNTNALKKGRAGAAKPSPAPKPAAPKPPAAQPAPAGEVYHVRKKVTSWARTSPNPDGKKVKRLRAGENYRVYASRRGPDDRIWHRTADGNWLNENALKRGRS